MDSLVVTKPLPESTIMLDPDVVTPKAAYADQMNRNKDKIWRTLRPMVATRCGGRGQLWMARPLILRYFAAP